MTMRPETITAGQTLPTGRRSVNKKSRNAEGREDRDFLFTHFNKAQEMLTKTYIIMNHSSQGMPLKQLLNALEKMIIDSALNVTRGSQKQAAQMLGVKQTALCEKMKKLKIKKPRKKNPAFYLSRINES